MQRFYRLFFPTIGYEPSYEASDPQVDFLWENATSGNPTRRASLYNGNVVPLGASQKPGECEEKYDNFFDQFFAVPHADGTSILIYPRTYEGETPTGQVLYGITQEDDLDPVERIQSAVKIYESLQGTCPRVVKYLGREPSGYRLERLSPGPMPTKLPAISDGPPVLALYQSWALQVLSAVQFFHGQDVVLNSISQQCLWLREDLSVAFVSIFIAGATGLDVSGSHAIGDDADFQCQWSFEGLMEKRGNEPELPEETFHVGHPKGDLFLWATWVYQLMVGSDSNFLVTEGMTHIEENVRALERGSFDAFPVLSEDQLGSVLLKCWKCEYDSVDEVLQDVVRALEVSEARVEDDEVTGHKWTDGFEIAIQDDGMGTELHLRSAK